MKTKQSGVSAGFSRNLINNKVAKKLLFVILAGMAVSSFAYTPAVASQPSYSGAYINLNAGIGSMQNVANSSFALGANAGYSFNRAFALEGGWTSLPSQQSGQLATYNIYDIAVKGTIPLGNIFSLYGRLGAAMGYSAWSGATCNPVVYQNSGSAYNYGALTGVGASFALSRHFDLRAEDYVFVPVSGNSGNFGAVNVLTGGVQFNF